MGQSDEVNGSAETDSRQRQISVQIPACSDTSSVWKRPEGLEIVNLADVKQSLFFLSAVLSVSDTLLKKSIHVRTTDDMQSLNPELIPLHVYKRTFCVRLKG